MNSAPTAAPGRTRTSPPANDEISRTPGGGRQTLGGAGKRARADDEQAGAGGGSLEDAARQEEDYLRERLRDELGREPSDEEVDEWLREHTEGY